MTTTADLLMAEAQRSLLLTLLETKFGGVPAETRERVSRALEGELVGWAKGVLSATTLEQVFAEK